ncbi:hypothetical protein GCM10011356_16080 [Kangiella profundi]|nr:hypothetical protein GCM10011356_16080 [Kangiella profundi]
MSLSQNQKQSLKAKITARVITTIATIDWDYDKAVIGTLCEINSLCIKTYPRIQQVDTKKPLMTSISAAFLLQIIHYLFNRH